MSTHLLAWYENVDSATLQRLTAIQDDVMTLSGTERFVIPPEYNHLHWASALGTSIARAQIITPSIQRRRSTLEVFPRRQGAETWDRSRKEQMQFLPPQALEVAEEIEFQAAEDGSGATDLYGLVSIGMAQLPPVPSGEIIRARGTGTTTLTAGAWTTVTLTLDNALPVGTYALVDFFGMGATAIAARALPQGGGYRPGKPTATNTEAIGADYGIAEQGYLGDYEMFRFEQNNVPQFQFLADAADTAQTILMKLIKVA